MLTRCCVSVVRGVSNHRKARSHAHMQNFLTTDLAIRQRIRYYERTIPNEEGGATLNINLMTQMSVCAAPLGMCI
jgi:hypothetical protein